MGVDAEVDEALDLADTFDRLDLAVDQVEQGHRVLADDLDHQVEAAGRHDDVDDPVDGGDLVGDLGHVAVDLHTEHGHHRVSDGRRVGHTHDLDDTGVEDALHPLADGRG